MALRALFNVLSAEYLGELLNRCVLGESGCWPWRWVRPELKGLGKNMEESSFSHEKYMKHHQSWMNTSCATKAFNVTSWHLNTLHIQLRGCKQVAAEMHDAHERIWSWNYVDGWNTCSKGTLATFPYLTARLSVQFFFPRVVQNWTCSMLNWQNAFSDCRDSSSISTILGFPLIPFGVDVDSAPETFQMELIKLQCDSALRGKCYTVAPDSYPLLSAVSPVLSDAPAHATDLIHASLLSDHRSLASVCSPCWRLPQHNAWIQTFDNLILWKGWQISGSTN